MLVSVSFSLKLVKMKVVTRLEMVVSTVTIHSAGYCLASGNQLSPLCQAVRIFKFYSSGGSGASSPSFLLVCLCFYLIDWSCKEETSEGLFCSPNLHPPKSSELFKNLLTSPSFLCLRKSIRKFADINKLKAEH